MHTHNRMVVTGGERGSNMWWLTETRLSGELTMQYTDGVLWNCTPETYRMLLNNVTLINLIIKNNCISSMRERREQGGTGRGREVAAAACLSKLIWPIGIYPLQKWWPQMWEGKQEELVKLLSKPVWFFKKLKTGSLFNKVT